MQAFQQALGVVLRQTNHHARNHRCDDRIALVMETASWPASVEFAPRASTRRRVTHRSRTRQIGLLPILSTRRSLRTCALMCLYDGVRQQACASRRPGSMPSTSILHS